MPGRLFVGTSGFRYWPGDVHPPGTTSDDALRLYASALPSVELNRPFYQMPRASTLAKYRSLVPPGFSFAVKIWRRVSHEKALLGVDSDWALVIDRLKPLVSPDGVFLLQLPKQTFPHDHRRLESFFARVPPDVRLAVEFRKDLWFADDTYELLRAHRVALVGVGAPGVPRVLDVDTAPFAYFRLHGPREWYKDRYSEEELKPFVEAACRRLQAGDVYVYFDNTIGGHAYWNALDFRRMVDRASGAQQDSAARLRAGGR